MPRENDHTPRGVFERILEDIRLLQRQLGRRSAYDPPAGAIVMWPAATPPDGWLPCDGRLISRDDYPGLFAVLGTTISIGDGSTTFGIPDYRGNSLAGSPAAPKSFIIKV